MATPTVKESLLSQQLIIKLDYREREFRSKLTELLTGSTIKLEENVNLDIGDIIIQMPERGQFIIERKRIDDMASSIKDGRYAEQKKRALSYISQLASSTCPGQLVYLLEGQTELCRTAADYNIVQGAWISLTLRDKVPVIRVLTMEEGCKWLIRLAERIISKPAEFFKPAPGGQIIAEPGQIKTILLNGGGSATTTSLQGQRKSVNPGSKQLTENPARAKINKSLADGGEIVVQQQQQELEVSDQPEPTELESSANGPGLDVSTAQSEYLATVKTKKKENITPATCCLVMLSVIPGMTSTTAQTILEKLNITSLPELINILAINPAPGTSPEDKQIQIKEKKKMLGDIMIKPGRRLGPALADKLWDYLFNNQ